VELRLDGSADDARVRRAALLGARPGEHRPRPPHYYLKWTNEALAEAGKAYYDKGLTTVGQLSTDAQRLRKTALTSMDTARQKFAAFDFIKASFAAQKAWRAAAAYRDLALGLAPGTTELQTGTKLAGASSCPSAQQ
jgi:hypothetical protein